MLVLTKSAKAMTKGELRDYLKVSAEILSVIEKKTSDNEGRAREIAMAAISLKSFERPPLNLKLEFEIDPQAFARDAGRLLALWADRLGELRELRPDLPPPPLEPAQMSAHLKQLWSEQVWIDWLVPLMRSWVAYNVENK